MGDAGQTVLVVFVQTVAGALALVACWNLFKALSR